ncbi:hypothetical protein V6N13_028290 [Hibiscus sabdariffa]
MASKSLVFLLAALLLVATKVSANEQGEKIEINYVKVPEPAAPIPVKAPAPPYKPPTPAPTPPTATPPPPYNPPSPPLPPVKTREDQSSEGKLDPDNFHLQIASLYVEKGANYTQGLTYA